jgi:hypothetical protein
VRFAPRKDVVGTTKLMMGLVLVPLVYLAVPALIAWAYGVGAGLAVLLLLPLSGVATLRTLERGTSLRRILRAAMAAVTLRERRDALITRRQALEARVVETVRRHIPEDLVPLFPRG